MPRPVYHVEIGGHHYEIEASNDVQAQHIADFISERVKAGDVDLKSGKPPEPVRFDRSHSAAAPETSTAGATARGVTRGGTLNWAEEIGSVGNALGLAPIDNLFGHIAGDQHTFWNDPEGFRGAIHHNMDEYRKLRAADEAQHGTAARVGEVLGALASTKGVGAAGRGVANLAIRVAPRAALPLAARMSAAALNSPIKTGIAQGMGTGAVAGTIAGAGEGDTVASRAKSAAGGGFAGATFGGLIGGTVSGLAPAMARAWRIFRGQGTEQEATHQLIQALQRDGYDVSSPAGVQALRQEISSFTGKPVSLADVGHATRARAGVAMRNPSDAQSQAIDTVEARAAGQGVRLAGDIRQTIAPRTDVHELEKALADQRSAKAKELRDKALFVDAPVEAPSARVPVIPTGVREAEDAGVRRAVGLNPASTETFARDVVPVADPAFPAIGRVSRVVDDPQLQQLARLPDAQKALGAALQRAEAERALLATQGKSIDHLPDLTPGADLDVRTMDYLKRHLDDEVNTLYKGADTSTFKAGQAHQVRDLRNAIRDRMKEVVPQYGDYLDAYSASKGMSNALEAGRGSAPGVTPRVPGFDQLDPEQIATGQAGRSTAEQELYRVGVARNILDKIRETKDGANAAGKILNSPESRDQLAATGVDPSNLDKLFTAVKQERQLNMLPDELRGSASQQRMAAQNDADAGAHLKLPFNVASPWGWAGAGIRKLTEPLSKTRNANVNEAILPMMLEQNPAAIDGIISRLEQQGQTAAAAILRKQALARRLSITAGTLAGGPAAVPEGDY